MKLEAISHASSFVSPRPLRAARRLGALAATAALVLAAGCSAADAGSAGGAATLETLSGAASACDDPADGKDSPFGSAEELYASLAKYAKPAPIGRGNAGVLVVKAEGPNVLLDVPEYGPKFQSEAEFFGYAKETLNAVPRFDKNQKLIGFDGDVEQSGALFMLDHDKKSVLPVNDVVAHLLGGRYGLFTIGDKPYCTTYACAKDHDQLTGEPYSQALGRVERCLGSGDSRVCVLGDTNIEQVLNYRRVGARTAVQPRDPSFWCWLSSLFGGTCADPADIGIRSAYVQSDGTPWGIQDTSRRTTAVEHSAWSLDFFFFSIGDSRVTRTSGVCGVHRVSRGNERLEFRTTHGDTRGRCP
jgi:hypothetical protein